MTEASDDKTLSSSTGQISFSTIGPYRLVERIGVGGMGEVWRAEQTAPFRRIVALKLIKAGMDTRAALARFESERQALALMEHPNIATVFDAGATPEGRPFFVMECVPGLPITSYCDRHRLTIRDRLVLFTEVCDGVQHAHQKAIIHRDLKPSNVLVTEVDQKPVPKIIDFGLAKATGPRLSDVTLYTEAGGVVGTPDYMSPEQADSSERTIDTRTDVYSLGVILYELLVGALPYDSRLGGAGTPSMLERILREEPTLPSSKLKSMGESSHDSAAKRQEEPQALRRHLRGELDWITMKALEKERSRRYGSPSELAADIQRYLNNEPVLAGPLSTTYRAGKFIRRHRFGMGVAAAAVMLLIAFAITMAVQARRIARERDRANHEAAASQRVADFMTQMFRVSDPSQARGNAVTAREILDKAATEVDSSLANDPVLQARLLHVMGKTYEGLGLYPRAESLLARSLEIRSRVLGSDNPDTLASMDDLAEAIRWQARFPEAEKLYREALDGRRRALGPDHPATLASMNGLALVLSDEHRFPEAEKFLRQAWEAYRRALGPSDPATLNSENSLALVLQGEGQFSEAEKLYRESADGFRSRFGPEHPNTLRGYANLAGVLDQEGHHAESEKLQRETIEIKTRVLGPEHPHTLISKAVLADTLAHLGRYAEAETLYRSTLDAERRAYGLEHPRTLIVAGTLADDLILQHKYSEAAKVRQELSQIYTRQQGPDGPDALDNLERLGILYAYQKQYAKAETIFQQSLQAAQRSSNKSLLPSAWYDYACAAAVAGHRDQAFEYLHKSEDLGDTDIANIDHDDDLKSLRGDPRFTSLMAQARARTATPARD
jgi:eukaryotic-like serine/threonine-protein kinase